MLRREAGAKTPLTRDILFVYEDGALGCTASPRMRISSTCLTLPLRSSLQPIGDVRCLLGSCFRHDPRRERAQLNLRCLGTRCGHSNLARCQRTATHCAGDAMLTSRGLTLNLRNDGWVGAGARVHSRKARSFTRIRYQTDTLKWGRSRPHTRAAYETLLSKVRAKGRVGKARKPATYAQ
jgi:hypothetical protein